MSLERKGDPPVQKKDSWARRHPYLVRGLVAAGAAGAVGIAVLASKFQTHELVWVKALACGPGDPPAACETLENVYIILKRGGAHVGDSNTRWPSVTWIPLYDEYGNPVEGELEAGMIKDHAEHVIPGKPGSSEQPVGTPDRWFVMTGAEVAEQERDVFGWITVRYGQVTVYFAETQQ